MTEEHIEEHLNRPGRHFEFKDKVTYIEKQEITVQTGANFYNGPKIEFVERERKEQEPQQPKQNLDPAITLLDVEVRAKLDANAEPKYVLLPAKAAKEAYVPLPFSNEVQFNARYNANISHATWSRWMNDTGKNGYEEKELAAYINKFTNL